MAIAYIVPHSAISAPEFNPFRTSITSSSSLYNPNYPILLPSFTEHTGTISKTHFNSLTNRNTQAQRKDREIDIPTMSEIMDSSKLQNLQIQLQTLGPFFRITASSLETKKELGRAEGLVRLWLGGKILHLDSIRLQRETLSLKRSIFGTGLFIGAVAVRYGYECGCRKAELLAINDTDHYHFKLVRFYTRIGFKAVHEVTGSSMEDLAHMLVWGGKGTRMDANIEDLLIKWGSRFKAQN